MRWAGGAAEKVPSGESRARFAARCVAAFESIREQTEDCALISHGGTIMAIMERFAYHCGSCYDFRVSNGCGFFLDIDGFYHTLP